MRRSLWLATALGAAAALAVGVVPAVAAASAPSPWHVVYRHQFAAHSYSDFGTITPGGPGELWAVGGYGVAGNGAAGAVLWKNHRWQVTPVPQPVTLGLITAVSADSASDAWAVTANGYVIRWNGSRWRIAKRLAEPNQGPPGDLPTGVLAISARNVWVFYGTWRDAGGLHGGALHDLNGVWKQVTGPGRTILRASAATPSQLWAIGGPDSAHAGLLRYGPLGWQPVRATALAGLTFGGVLAQRSGPVWAVGWPSNGKGPGALMKLSGGAWTRHPMPAAIQPGPGAFAGAAALAGDGHGGVWITAPAFFQGSGHLLHFANGGWQLIGLGVNVNADSVASVPGSDTLCASGHANNYKQAIGTALVWSTGTSC